MGATCSSGDSVSSFTMNRREGETGSGSLNKQAKYSTSQSTKLKANSLSVNFAPTKPSATSASKTLEYYGYLCRSTASHILNHDQLACLSSLARLVRYNPKEVIYQGGDEIRPDCALYFVIDGSCTVSKYVEMRETTSFGGGTAHSDAPLSLPQSRAPKQNLNRPQQTHPSTNHSVPTTHIPARWTNIQDKADNTFEVKLKVIKDKGWFGYCTMLDMTVRQSTVTATEHTMCLVWSEANLNELFSLFPGTSALLRDAIAGYRVMNELRNASFLTNLQEEHSALLCTLFQPRYIPANTVIFEEGEPSTDSSLLYFLIQGSAVMYQAVDGGGSNLVKAIEPGGIFGEACTLFRLPRIGTVRTNHASFLMELSFASLAQFLKYTPGLGVDVKKAFNNNTIPSVYLMQNPVILQAFQDFCFNEHSSENVEFFRDAKAFRTSGLRSKALVQLDARDIYQKYIDIKSDRQVNLFSATRDRIASAIEHSIINKLTFEEAEEEILHLMDRDSFSRFKASGLFQEALQKCRDKPTS